MHFIASETLTKSWQAYEGGKTIGDVGSENGIIIMDEEVEGLSRITLERNADNIPFAITCAIYGWLVHTVFFSTEREAQETYIVMKRDLEFIAHIVDTQDDFAPIVEAAEKFVDKYQ
jgi:hypothetical protein